MTQILRRSMEECFYKQIDVFLIFAMLFSAHVFDNSCRPNGHTQATDLARSSKIATAGKVLPSRYSKKAPPPVEI